MDVLTDFLNHIEAAPPGSLEPLLGRILGKSRALSGAEAGMVHVFTRGPGERMLDPVALQFDGHDIRAGRIRLPLNSSSIAGYVGLTGETVNVGNVYDIAPDKPYRFNPVRDRALGFHSRSMLCFALTNFAGAVVAVVQLVNRRQPASGRAAVFPRSLQRRLEGVARVLGGEVERTMMLERIRAQNKALRERSRKLADQQARIAELQQQTEEAFRLSVGLLARAAEIYDEGTGNHIVRVNEYSHFLADRLGMPKEFCDEIRFSAQLHDVGKMGVDAGVLKKTGPLSAADREEMNRHPIYGHEILRRNERLEMAAEIALNHHEKWDGSGYPRGLKGEAIPLSARIVQIADVYDALRAARHYKTAIGHERAVDIILRGDERIDPRGHFDPRLLAVFAEHHHGFDRIWRELAD